MNTDLNARHDYNDIGFELFNAAFLPLAEFVTNVRQQLQNAFDICSTTLLSYHHDRWTYLPDSEAPLPTGQLILGDDQMELERNGLLLFKPTLLPKWIINTPPFPGKNPYITIIRLTTRGDSSKQETNGALLIQSPTELTPNVLSTLISLSRYIGHALDLAIKNSRQLITAEVTARLFDSPDLNSFLHRIASLARTTLQAEAATIWLLDHTTNLIRIGGTTGLKDAGLPVRQVFLMRRADAIPAKMIFTNRENPMFIDDVEWLETNWETNERYIDATTAPTKSLLYAPIVVRPTRAQTRVVGILRVTNRQIAHTPKAGIISFTNEDLIWASHICDLLALIVHSTNAAQKLLRLYEMVMHGTKTALDAINDNLISLKDSEDITKATPHDLKYSLPDSISFIDDLRWQVKRADLWQRLRPEWEPQSTLIGSTVLPKVKELASRMAPVHEVDHVIFRYDEVKNVPPVAADANALLAVLRNLTENSLKYCRDRNCNISIKIEYDENYVRLFVEDDGIGIPEEERSFIFWGGYRGDRAMRHHPKGAGIGLSWSQSVMRDLGGTLKLLQSEKKTGCVFVLEIPVWKDSL